MCSSFMLIHHVWVVLLILDDALFRLGRLQSIQFSHTHRSRQVDQSAARTCYLRPTWLTRASHICVYSQIASKFGVFSCVLLVNYQVQTTKHERVLVLPGLTAIHYFFLGHVLCSVYNKSVNSTAANLKYYQQYSQSVCDNLVRTHGFDEIKKLNTILIFEVTDFKQFENTSNISRWPSTTSLLIWVSSVATRDASTSSYSFLQ